MTTRTVRRKAGVKARPGLAREAHHHILCRPHTAGTLARSLGVSVATVARALVELRRLLSREGARLVSVKEGASWRYEVRDRDEDVWSGDPFVRAVGFAAGVRRPRGEGVDEALYGRLRRPH